MFFDTHAHYDAGAFNADREELAAALPQGGVALVLNPGCDRESSEGAMTLADRYAHFYAAAGWHPHDSKNFDAEGAEDFLERAARHPKVMAIGEMGLDFHYDHSPRDVQREVFVRQMDFARACRLPVIIHSREAHEETMKIVRRYPDLSGEFHCYSGSAEAAREILEMGWYLSFNGVVTYKNARRAIETLEITPPDRILLETDAPYLSPVPFRGKRCDSRMLTHTVQKIAEVLGMSEAAVASLTMENGKRFFGIE